MSSTRREELVKILVKRVEQCRVAIRNVRRDVNTLVKDLEKSKTISEDYGRRLQDSLQTVTDKMIKAVDTINDKKTNELKSL